MSGTQKPALSELSPEKRARRRAKDLADLMWHIGVFVIINVFLWLLDLLGPGGIDWAYWVTGGWGIGLAFHVLTFFVDGSQFEYRKAQQYLEQDRRRDQLEDDV